MIQQSKIEKMNYYKDIFNKSKNYIFNNFSGLTVEKITELRRSLAKSKAKFVVVKNTLARKLLKEKNIPDVGDSLTGTTAVAFVNDEVNEALKTLFEFEKNSSLKVKGGWVNESIYDIKQLLEISKLPGKAQLLAMLMSTMKAPVQNFVFACNDIAGRLVRVLDAIAKTKK
jgi:large subunit ribosomal protein L10